MLSLICTFVIDVVVHVNNTGYANCMFTLHATTVRRVCVIDKFPLERLHFSLALNEGQHRMS